MKHLHIVLALLMFQVPTCAATMHIGFRFSSDGEIELIIRYNALLNTSDVENLEEYCIGLHNYTIYSEEGYRICEIRVDLSGTEMIQGNNIVFENGFQGQDLEIESATRLFVIMEARLISLSNNSTVTIDGNEYSWTSDIPEIFSSLKVTYSIDMPHSTYKYVSLGVDSEGNALLRAGNSYQVHTGVQESLVLNALELLVESVRGKKSAMESKHGINLNSVILNSSSDGETLDTEILVLMPGFLNDTEVRTGFIPDLELGMTNLNYFEFRGREIEESTLGNPQSSRNLTYVWNNVQVRDLGTGRITLKTYAGFGVTELLIYAVGILLGISLVGYAIKKDRSSGGERVMESALVKQKSNMALVIFSLVLLAFSLFWNVVLFQEYHKQRELSEALAIQVSQISAESERETSKLEKKAVIFRDVVFVNEKLIPTGIQYVIERSDYIKYVIADHSLLLIDAKSYATDDEEELIWLTSEVVGDATDEELKAKRILRFVQSIRYEEDLDSFTKYPLETLVDASGDCEDLSVLAATMLKIAGIDSALIVYPEHVQVGIALGKTPSDYASPAYYTKAGRNFYPAECTSIGWEIGDCAEQCKETPAHILIM